MKSPPPASRCCAGKRAAEFEAELDVGAGVTARAFPWTGGDARRSIDQWVDGRDARRSIDQWVDGRGRARRSIDQWEPAATSSLLLPPRPGYSPSPGAWCKCRPPDQKRW